jgi:hypothetical protein
MPEELEGTERRYFHQFKEGGTVVCILRRLVELYIGWCR